LRVWWGPRRNHW